MKRLLILGNKEKDHVREAVQEIEPWLRRRAEITVDLGMECEVKAGQFDFAVVFGGDGSVLRAARMLAEHQVPIIGINVGKFGFLTETTSEQAREALSDVLDGRFSVAERMMLRCDLLRGGQPVESSFGLNDVVVSRTALSRLMTIDFFVNEELVTTYRADGLIISTPVGSTAHSMAAGGPIVSPELDAFIVSPICPHTLSNRPLVLPAGVRLQAEVKGFSEPPSLTIDGQVNWALHEGCRAAVHRANESARLIQTGRWTYFETLRNKLDWRGQPRYVR